MFPANAELPKALPPNAAVASVVIKFIVKGSTIEPLNAVVTDFKSANPMSSVMFPKKDKTTLFKSADVTFSVIDFGNVVAAVNTSAGDMDSVIAAAKVVVTDDMSAEVKSSLITPNMEDKPANVGWANAAYPNTIYSVSTLLFQPLILQQLLPIQ